MAAAMERTALTLLLLLAGCARSEGPVRLAVGGRSQMVYLPVALAEARGELGPGVEVLDFPGGSKALEALLAGSADVVAGFYDHTLQMAAQGKRVTAFVAMLERPAVALVVSPNARQPVRTIADLQGRLVGVTAPGSSSHLILQALLRRNGLKADAVSVTGIGATSSALAAARNGIVDAAVLLEPALSMLERQGGMVVLADTRTEEGLRAALGVERYTASVLYARDEWLREHPKEAARLAQAIARTLGWMQKAQGAEVLELVPGTLKGPDDGAFVKAFEGLRGGFSADGRFTEAGVEGARKVMALPAAPAPTFTNDYLAPPAP